MSTANQAVYEPGTLEGSPGSWIVVARQPDGALRVVAQGVGDRGTTKADLINLPTPKPLRAMCYFCKRWRKAWELRYVPSCRHERCLQCRVCASTRYQT